MLVFVDVEAGPAPGQSPDLHDFGAVLYVPRPRPEGVGPCGPTFRGMRNHGSMKLTVEGPDTLILGNHGECFRAFADWLETNRGAASPHFVSDNVAFDWQWINYYFWQNLHRNPFGHSGRRISDFYAGLRGDFRKTQEWKRLRVTAHDHNPVNDAKGNVEAFDRILAGER